MAGAEDNMPDKPRLLIVADDGQYISYILLIKDQIDIDLTRTWAEFDDRLERGAAYAAAVIMPLVATPDARRHSFLTAIAAFRARFPATPIFAHMSSPSLHADIIRVGATAVALLPRDVEELIARELRIPYTKPERTAPAPRPLKRK